MDVKGGHLLVTGGPLTRILVGFLEVHFAVWGSWENNPTV